MINVGLMGFQVDGDVQGGDAAVGGKRGADVSKEAAKKRSRGSSRTRTVYAAESLTHTHTYTHTCAHRQTTKATFTHSEVIWETHSGALCFQPLWTHYIVFLVHVLLPSRWLKLTPHIITDCHLSQLINVKKKKKEKRMLWNAGWVK